MVTGPAMIASPGGSLSPKEKILSSSEKFGG
jgi:hypothetical protein